ncbi:MAG: leucine-rich repeat domain-containing protein [Bacteroidetes bacterium]|nr:leucine-rich repeat domain-containing protein [Bacteroidota bacterium]
MQQLDLEGTQVSNLEPIKGLTSLLRLNLQGTQVSDLEPIKGLTNLTKLILKSTQVSDLEPIKSLTRLEHLDLEGTIRFVQDGGAGFHGSVSDRLEIQLGLLLASPCMPVISQCLSMKSMTVDG